MKNKRFLLYFAIIASLFIGGIGGYYIAQIQYENNQIVVNEDSQNETNQITANEPSQNETNQITANEPSQNETNPTNNNISDTSEVPTEIDIDQYKIKYIDPITIGCPIGMMDWTNASDIAAKYFIQYYSYISLSDPSIKYTQFRHKTEDVYAVPRDVVEKSIKSHFSNIESMYIQTMKEYDLKNECYISTFTDYGTDAIVSITNVQEDNDTIIITFEAKLGSDKTQSGNYEVGISKEQNGLYKYSYGKVLDGFSYSTTGITSYANWNYPRVLYYHKRQPLVRTLGSYGGVLANSDYDMIQSSGEIKYEALFIDAGVNDLQEEWVKSQLKLSEKEDYAFRVFIGYEDIEDLYEIKWLKINEKKIIDKNNKQFIELKLVNDTITLGDKIIQSPEDDQGFIKAFLYAKNKIVESPTNSISKHEYDANTFVAEKELNINGLAPYISLDEALIRIGGYDSRFLNADDMSSYVKDGVRYCFTWQNEEYCLHAILADDYAEIDDCFPRGIKLGDSLEDVLSKIPGKDKSLKEWSDQFIYGQRGSNYANLGYTIYGNRYDLRIGTENGHEFYMLFDKENKLLNMSVSFRWEGNY